MCIYIYIYICIHAYTSVAREAMLVVFELPHVMCPAEYANILLKPR